MKRSGAVARGLSTRSLLPVPSLQPHLSLSRASLSFPRHRRSFSSPTLWAPHPSPFSCASSSTASLPSLLLFGVSAASARTSSVTRRPLGFHAPARPYATTQEMYSKDLYSVLGVKGSATQDEIKTAFYKKAKEYHPDMNKENPHAQKKFVEATSAYEILKDTRKRSEYDGVRRMRTDSSSTYTSYTHSDYANYGGSGGSGRARRGDDFGMGHEDFTRWYQQRSDIFEDFEKMFKDIAERMSKKMKAQWIRMCENGEVGFEDIYDIYGRMQRTERKTKKRQDKKKKKADERRRHTNHTAGCDGYATTNGPPRQQKKKERKGKSEDDATQASQRTEKKESSGEEGGKKRAKSEGNAKNEGNAKGGSQRRSSSRARKDYQWGKWDRKHAINAEKEGSDRESSSGSGRESREQKATEDARRKERRWQKKKAEIRKRWRHGYHDPDMIIFF